MTFVDEIEWLHRNHNIRFCTIADENPTTNKLLWTQVLQELEKRRLPVKFFATIRATDLVRDADILDLYRRAGILYILMGIESTNPEVLKQVKKGSTTRHDYEACRLLKQHRIFSVMGQIVGLEDDSWQTFRHARRQLSLYDGDYLNAMYVTPHSWTQFSQSCDRRVVQPDQSKWDYRHQVLAQVHLKPWQLFALTKWLELCFHLRPVALWRFVAERDPARRRQRWWSLFHTGGVWFAEIYDFCFRTTFNALPEPLAQPKTVAATAKRSAEQSSTVGRSVPITLHTHPLPALQDADASAPTVQPATTSTLL